MKRYVGDYVKNYVKRRQERLGNSETVNVNKGNVRVWVYEPNLVNKDSVKFFDAFAMDLLVDNEILCKAIKLLFYIASNLDYEQEVFYLSPRKASKDLKVTERMVYNWLRILIDKGIIIKSEDRNWYRINKKYVLKGSVVATVEE